MIRIVIMASGFGRRMGCDKLVEPLLDRPVLAWVLESALKAGADGVTVVYRSPAVQALAQAVGAEVLYNPAAAEGQSAGIRLAAERFQGTQGLLFMAGDQPLVKPETLETMIRRFKEEKPDIISGAWQGVRCLPALFSGRLLPELRLLQGDQGGRALMGNGGYRVLLQEFQQEEEGWDIDTAEALLRVTQRLRIRAAGGHDART